jgi:phage N-6-adenine-methyltransferase
MYVGTPPSLEELLRDGRASNRRIRCHEATLRRTCQERLTEWLDQAERLWIASKIHGLIGKRFTVFAAQIGIDRSSAFEVVKLHPHRTAVLDRCKREDHWPGWKVTLDWFNAAADEELPEEISNYEPTSRNRGVLTPTWQRWKTAFDEYGTPQELFDYYDRRYKFTCDVASSKSLAKCKNYYTRKQDGLKQPWTGVIWLNPPYGGKQIGAWVKKAHLSAQKGAVVVALLPVFTDTAWFRDYASHATIELLHGRLQFIGGNGHAPFAHMICVRRKNPVRRGNRLAITLAGHQIVGRR